MMLFWIIVLYLGLSLDIRIPVLAGPLSKPTLRALPSNVITTGNQVTFFCEAPLDTKEYLLYKKGSQDYLIPTAVPETEKKAMFSISSLQWYNAGQYWCQYKISNETSEYSDMLELVVTGFYHNRTILSAIPSPVVTSGGNVTLQCESQEPYNTLVLMKDGKKFSNPVPSQNMYSRLFGAQFRVGPVTANQRWRFTCYGYSLSSPQLWSVPSNDLELLVSGEDGSDTLSNHILLDSFPVDTKVCDVCDNSGPRYLTPHTDCGSQGKHKKANLWAEPGSVIALRNAVTIFCEGTKETQIYFLHKEGSPKPLDSQTPKGPGNKAFFSIASMERHHAGKYWCYSYGSAGWSRQSDPLELVVTGFYSIKVTLSALPSPVVISGQNASLQCLSKQAYDGFILMKDDQKFSSAVSSQNIHTGLSGASFKVGPVTPNQRWRFTCYGYYLNNSQLLSVSSNALQLLVSGNLHKPNIWAHPGSVISSGSSVTIWCAGTLQALTYVIHKEGSPGPIIRDNQVDHNNKAKFLIPSLTSLNAGQYNCYSYSSAGWTERSDTLELVVTGVHDGKPTLSAFPSTVVTSGGNVTLQCNSSKGYNRFILTGADLKFSRSQNAQFINNGSSQALFPENSLTYSKNGPFRCYGYYRKTPYVWSEASNPLEIYVSGLSRKPYLMTQQGTVLAPGENLKLKCFSETNYDRFSLYKEGEHDLTQVSVHQPQDGHFHANFSLGSGNYFIGGRYRCLGAHNNSSEWSAPSDPLDIMITGHPLVTLNLSVHPGATVSSGENVTLLCQSSGPVDTFFLFKEIEGHPYMQQRSQSQDPKEEAKFSMNAVTSDLGASYICFGSKRSSPFLLSHSSVPVDIIVSDSQPQDHTVENLIRMAMSGLIVTVVAILLFMTAAVRERV